MSALAEEMSEIVHLAAASDAVPGEGVKAAIRRAARKLSMHPRRVKGFWYREVRRVTAEEADAMRAARVRLLRERAEKLNSELEAVRAQLTVIEGKG